MLGISGVAALLIAVFAPTAAALARLTLLRRRRYTIHDQDSELQSWSSLIGIITAIVGNVLVSLAINIQRYAHIRLNRERAGKEPSTGEDLGSTWQERTYGSRENGNVPLHPNERDEGFEGAPHSTPTEPLLVGDTFDAGFKDQDLGDQDSSASPQDHRSNASDQQHASSERTDSLRSTQKTYLRSPFWWAGLILMIIGEAGNFIAYGFAPASIVSPLGVVALISNCLVAPIMFQESFRLRDFLGVLVATGGAVTVVLSANPSERKMGPDDIWHAITRWEFEVYLGITLTFIVIGILASKKYGERTILIDLGLVALCGGYTALSTKGISSLLSYKLWHLMTFPITYLLLVVLISSALLQIRYVNRALQRFNSTQVVPTQFVLFTISVIVGSAILYRDFERATPAALSRFVGGCLLTFGGVYLITGGREHMDSS